MDKALIASLIFVAGVGVGYMIGEELTTRDYERWQREHQFRCWTGKKNASRPGDFPQVFVIDNRREEKSNDLAKKRSIFQRILQKV